MQTIKELLKNNKLWAKAKKAEDPNFFKSFKNGQSPSILLLGCSDSRVLPSLYLDAEMGSIFIHRNIANVAAHGDMNFLSVLQYSIEILKVKHIIVNGHYGCGGIDAAISDENFGLIENWLANIVDVIKFHKKELDSIADRQKKIDRLVELNVLEQMENIKQTSIYKKAATQGKAPQLHGWVFDFNTGDIKILT